MFFLGGHNPLYIVCAVCVCVCESVTAWYLLYRPSWQQGNFITVIIADITGDKTYM